MKRAFGISRAGAYGAGTDRPLRVSATRSQPSRNAFDDRRARRRILLQVLVCALPAAALLAANKAFAGAYYFWGVCALLLLRAAFVGGRDEVVCLLVGLAPLMNLLRDFAFHNVVAALFGAAVVHAYFRPGPAGAGEVLRRRPHAVAALAFVTVYYVASFLLTGIYSVNIRLFDFAFAMVCVLLIARRAAVLGSALFAMMLSAIAVGVSMLPHVDMESADRLGMVVIEGRWLGNPVQLGLPLALSLLALLVDRGRWLGLEGRPLARLALGIPCATLLALTASRASWLVVGGGILATLLFGRGQRVPLLVLAGVAVLAFPLLTAGPYGKMFEAGVERTFGEDRNLRQRSSGRSDQWLVADYAFRRSLGGMLHGYGPGSGAAVYALYSPQVPEVEFAVGAAVPFHSLFMQLAVETGLLGLLPLAVWLATALRRILRQTRRTGLVLPLACLTGYLLVVMTVSGYDSVSGIFMGIALLAAPRPAQTRAAPSLATARLPVTGTLPRRLTI